MNAFNPMRTVASWKKRRRAIRQAVVTEATG
jgi:hypothetical protein